jgi:hypothetical protein
VIVHLPIKTRTEATAPARPNGTMNRGAQAPYSDGSLPAHTGIQ